jgi:uncharacterized protein (TIGR02145 family)
MEIYVGNDTLKLNSTKTTAYTVRQFSSATNTFTNIYSNPTTFGDSIAVSAKWISGSGTTVTATGKYKFTRNYQKTINVQLNTTTNTFNFEGWANTVTDIDGNVYKTVTIGTQTWMTSNLRVTHYRDGSSITNVTDDTTWDGFKTGAWCDMSNSAANGTIYGHLYNWYAVNDSRNIAPLGWHVPTITEWTTLITYLGGGSLAGVKLTELGFSPLKGGCRGYLGSFVLLGFSGSWWSATRDAQDASGAWDISIGSGGVNKMNIESDMAMRQGESVRCIRDN